MKDVESALSDAVDDDTALSVSAWPALPSSSTVATSLPS
jgi:hypothetical protein